MRSEPASSANKLGCFGKIMALLTALGGGAGIVALLNFFQNPPNIPHTPSTSGPVSAPSVNSNGSLENNDDASHPATQQLSPPPSISNEPVSALPVELNINWGNIPQYFKIKKINFKKGFQKADSELSFIAESIGNFSGSLLVYFYDSDKIIICPSTMGIENYCSVIGYQGFVFLSTKGGRGNFYSWQDNEADRIIVSVPSNAATIKFIFNQ